MRDLRSQFVEAWQTPFREIGILSNALMALDSNDTTYLLRKQYLRVIGNCVADNGTIHRFTVWTNQQLIIAKIRIVRWSL
jgi:hypothetical protein